MKRFWPRTAQWVVALGLCAGLAGLAACGGGGSGEEPPEEALPQEALGLPPGGWVLTQGDCTQRLSLDASGGFVLDATVSLGAQRHSQAVVGTYEISTAAGGVFATFLPAQPVSPTGLFYCGQWAAHSEAGPEAAELAELLGVDPATLKFHTEVSASLGKISLGVDANRLERVAIHGGAGAVPRLDLLPGSLYRAHPGDANASLTEFFGWRIVNFPGQVYTASFPGISEIVDVAKLMLNFAAAATVTLSAGGSAGLRACELVIYETPTLGPVQQEYAVAAGQTSLTFTANPGEPGDFFFRFPVATAAGSATAHLLPATVRNPAPGGCAINLRARPLAVAVVEGLVKQETPPLFDLAGLGDSARMVENVVSAPGRFRLHSFPPSLVRGWTGVAPRLVALPPLAPNAAGSPPGFDGLALLRAGEPGVEMVVQTEPEGEFLNVFPTPESTEGMGPFRPYLPPLEAEPLALPGGFAGEFAAAQQPRHFKLVLEVETRVDLQSAGTAASGELVDEGGRPWGRNAGGAPEGVGFRLVRWLPAGAYFLSVAPQSAPGAFTLSATVATTSFPDDGLQACILDAPGGATPTALGCENRGIVSLQGIEARTQLRHLSLEGNEIQDLAPLGQLPFLEELALDGNPVSALGPLAGLAGLARLSLARCPIGPGQLPLLAGMKDYLRYLDLTGVETLAAADVILLKAVLANTTIVAPGGEILE